MIKMEGFSFTLDVFPSVSLVVSVVSNGFFQFPCFFNEAIFSDLDHDQQQLYDSCQSKADQNKARTLKDCILSARERVDRFSLSDPKQKCFISLNVVNWCLIQ